MNPQLSNLARILAVAGAVCLIAGALSFAPATPGATFIGGTLNVVADGAEHLSYGNWVYTGQFWLYVQDVYGPFTAQYSIPFGVTVSLLYNFSKGVTDGLLFHFDEQGAV